MISKIPVLITLFLFLSLFEVSYGQDHHFDSPWNTPPASKVYFTVPGVDNVPDLFGDINDPQLVIFFGGNQFMVVDELVNAFKRRCPQYTRVFFETLPPGILARQIAEGSMTIGNMRINLKPDVYTAGKSRFDQTPQWFSRTEVYGRNKLAIMVQKGNLKKINSLVDLGRQEVRVSMPNPAWEGIGKRIEEAYVKVGGDHLKNIIMDLKVKDSITYLTQIHHRQSPMRILYNQSDAAPVWYTEAFYQKMIGNPIDIVEIPNSQNIVAISMVGLLKAAPHKKAGKDFLDFLITFEAKSIFRKYGFNIE